MRFLLDIAVVLTCLGAVTEGSLRGPTSPSTGRRGSSSPQISQEPASLRTIQETLSLLMNKIDLVSFDVSATKQQTRETFHSVDQILKHFVKTSCDDFVSPPQVGEIGSGGRVSRQNSAEGVFTIYPRGGTSKKVKCDVSSTGEPGWTVVLLRESDSVKFNKTYEEYRNGFGDPSEDVWIGLDMLHELTSSQPHQLRVELRQFSGAFGFAHYEHFSVSDANTSYKLSVDGYNNQSTAGDGLVDHNGMLFSTYDRDNDMKYQSSCSIEMGGSGGWWYNSCYNSLGTGIYRTPPTPTPDNVKARRGSTTTSHNRSSSSTALLYGGITWHPFSHVKQSLKMFKMLIKPTIK